MTRNELRDEVRGQGYPATFTQTKAPGNVIVIPAVLTQSTSRATEPVVQQYGVNGREFIFLAEDFGALVPERFDKVEIGGERYALDAVMPLHEERTGFVMGWRSYVKGK